MIKTAQVTKEITITLENKIGELAKISKLLSERGVDIQAIAGYIKSGTNEAEIQLVTDNDTIAIDTLKKNSFNNIIEKNIISVTLENKPGALEVVTSLLLDSEVDIKYIYATSCTKNGCTSCKVILNTCDNQKAILVLTP